MCKYKLSVITINYNNREGLKRTIESVINQSNKDFEFIIIDGGSVDGSVEVIKEYISQLSYWVSEKDRGIYHAMNKGVAAANGEYCIFMNSGDMFYSNNVIADVYNNGLSADIVTGIIVLGADKFPLKWFPPLSVSFATFYFGTLSHQASFIRTSLLLTTPYDENLRIISDWKFFLQVLVIQNVSYKAIEIIVAQFDNTPGVGTTNQTEAEAEQKQVLADIFPNRVLIDYEKMNTSMFSFKKKILKFTHRYRLINQLREAYLRYKYTHASSATSDT